MSNEKIAESQKDKAMRLMFALFCERVRGKWVVSVGRVSWWLSFIPALYIWLLCPGEGVVSDITDHHMTLLITLAAYNLGKHGLEAMFKKKEEKEEVA